MTTGVAGVMMALRDRVTTGGSYHVHSSLTTVNTLTLSPEVGLYPPEVVEECQKRFKWRPMRAEHHVSDLMVTVLEGCKMVFAELLEEDSKHFTTFDKSAFGDRKLSILKPVVELDGSAQTSQPVWRSGSVPYCMNKKEDIAWLA